MGEKTIISAKFTLNDETKEIEKMKEYFSEKIDLVDNYTKKILQEAIKAIEGGPTGDYTDYDGYIYHIKNRYEDLVRFIDSIRYLKQPTDRQILNYIEHISTFKKLSNILPSDDNYREKIVIFPMNGIMTKFQLDEKKNKFVPTPLDGSMSREEYIKKFGHLYFKITINNIILRNYPYNKIKEYPVQEINGEKIVKRERSDIFYLPQFLAESGVKLSRKFFQEGNEKYKKQKKKELFDNVKKTLKTIEELKKKIK